MGFFEVLRRRFLKDRRRERPEWLAVFDPAVESVLHLGPARVHDDTAVAQRPRPPLHPPLEPADHLSVSNVLCCLAAQLLFWEFTVAQTSLLEDLLDGCSGETGAPVGMVHHE